MLPSLCIVLLTYTPSVDHPRALYAEVTLGSILNRLYDYDGELRVHIADDGSPPEHRNKLRELAGGYRAVVAASTSNSEQGGYGKNYNLAMQTVHAHSEIILPLEDDWELTGQLYPDRLVKALLEARDDGMGCIRLGYIGWTQPLRGELRRYAEQTFLHFDSDSPEPHVWAGHPRIETREYQRAIGPWDEGYDPGTTEFLVANREASRRGVLWPLDAGVSASQSARSMFAHIGAVQARTDQVPA